MTGTWRRRCSFSTARDCKRLALLEEEKANALGFCFFGSSPPTSSGFSFCFFLVFFLLVLAPDWRVLWALLDWSASLTAIERGSLNEVSRQCSVWWGLGFIGFQFQNGNGGNFMGFCTMVTHWNNKIKNKHEYKFKY